MTLRQLREEYGLSKQELADKARMGLSTIYAYEAGTRRPKVCSLRMLAEVLDERVYRLRFGWLAYPPTRHLTSRSVWKCPGRCTTSRPRLHVLRRRAGLTQKELAERARLGVETIAELEAGEVRPRRSTLALLAEVLGPGVSNAEFGWRLCQPATNHP